MPQMYQPRVLKYQNDNENLLSISFKLKMTLRWGEEKDVKLWDLCRTYN